MRPPVGERAVGERAVGERAAGERAAGEPSRSLLSALAERLNAVTVSEPHADGLAGVMNCVGVWMMDREGHVWHVMFDPVLDQQATWARLGERLVLVGRAPWRWLPGHRARVGSLTAERLTILDELTAQHHQGTLVDYLTQMVESDDVAWAAQDATNLLALWTTVRMTEGHTSASARMMLALRLPAHALLHPAVARWREDSAEEMLLLGLG